MHQVLRDVFTEWSRLRGGGVAPERAALTPANMPGALPDLLMLAVDPAGGHPVRLAGSRVCALFGGELRGRAFSSLFAAFAQDGAVSLVDRVADSQVPVIASLIGAGVEHGPLPLELLLLPLRVDGNARERLLGVLAPTSLPWWLIADPIRTLAVRRTHGLALGQVAAA